MAAIAWKLVRLGHDPQLVRQRMGLSSATWVVLCHECPALALAERQWLDELTRHAEAKLARASSSGPEAAVAYLNYVDRSRLAELERRKLERELWTPADERAASLDRVVRKSLDVSGLTERAETLNGEAKTLEEQVYAYNRLI